MPQHARTFQVNCYLKVQYTPETNIANFGMRVLVKAMRPLDGLDPDNDIGNKESGVNRQIILSCCSSEKEMNRQRENYEKHR